MKNNKKRALNSIALRYSTKFGLQGYTNRYQFEVCKKYFVGNTVLELGCADGETTKLLANHFRQVIAVDGSSIALERLRKYCKAPNISLIEGMFEELRLTKLFDTIFMGHILEHVVQPVQILKQYSQYLAPEGRIIITIPNALSLHRLAAVDMGLLKTPYQLSPRDHHIGHQRVYDRNLMEKDIKKSGLSIMSIDGYWLKPLNNKQIEDQWTPKQIEAYMRLGHQYPEYCAELIFVCTKTL